MNQEPREQDNAGESAREKAWKRIAKTILLNVGKVDGGYFDQAEVEEMKADLGKPDEPDDPVLVEALKLSVVREFPGTYLKALEGNPELEAELEDYLHRTRLYNAVRDWKELTQLRRDGAAYEDAIDEMVAGRMDEPDPIVQAIVRRAVESLKDVDSPQVPRVPRQRPGN